MNQFARAVTISNILCLFWVCAVSAWGQDLEYVVEPVPEADIRDSARRILDDPAFAGFDHFQREIPQSARASTGNRASSDSSRAANESDQAASDQGSSSTRPPQTWWERLKQNQQGQTSGDTQGKGSASGGTPASGSTSTESKSPGSSSQQSDDSDKDSASNSTPKNDAASGPVRRGDAEATTSSKDSTQDHSTSSNESSARPQRATGSTTGSPVLRGGDGIERPVRFAPKPTTPPPAPSNSNWNLDWGLGNAFSGIGQALGGLLHLVAYAGVAILVILIFVLAARGLTEWFGGRRKGMATSGFTSTPLADDRSPGEVEADVYLEQALDFARNGDFRSAIGSLLLGAMSTIERQQWIRYRRGLTLADYLRSVRSKADIHDGLRTIVGVHEPVEYGRRVATKDGFESALAGYTRAFSQ